MNIKKACSFIFDSENNVIFVLLSFYVLGFVFGLIHSYQNGVQAVDSVNVILNDNFVEVFFEPFFVLLVIFLAGFAVFGLPVAVFSVMYSGVLVGVLFSAFVISYGFKGSFILTVFGSLFYIVRLISALFVSFSSIRLSIVLLNVFRNNSRCVSPKVYLYPHIIKFLFFSMLLFLSAVIYSYVSVPLIKIIFWKEKDYDKGLWRILLISSR